MSDDNCEHCPHFLDNQGLCHKCGVLLEPEWWAAYYEAADESKNQADAQWPLENAEVEV